MLRADGSGRALRDGATTRKAEVRTFIAAWPDQDTREGIGRLLAALPAALPARPMQPRNIHLTLAFIGQLDQERAQAVASACRTLQPQRFGWTIDRLGWFRRARVAWLGGEVNDSLGMAATSARALLDRMAVDYDRKPFVPHVTIFRDVRAFDAIGPLAEPIAWRTTHIALYASAHDNNGPVYRRLGDD